MLYFQQNKSRNKQILFLENPRWGPRNEANVALMLLWGRALRCNCRHSGMRCCDADSFPHLQGVLFVGGDTPSWEVLSCVFHPAHLVSLFLETESGNPCGFFFFFKARVSLISESRNPMK